jgi:hypothetical protein
MWDGIKNHYLKTNISTRTRIIRKICNKKLAENGDMSKHIQEMNDLFQQLSEMGENQLSNVFSVAFLLSSLPESYNNLITAMESRDETQLTMSFVQSKLVEEYERRKPSDQMDSGESAFKITNYQHSKYSCLLQANRSYEERL